MAYQPSGGGGGGGGGGVIPDLNLPLPETGEEAPPLPAAEADRVSSPPEKRMRRVDDDQGGQRKEVAEAPVFPILELPLDLLWRILTHLPLKDAIRSGVLAQGWRDLWKSRWSDPTSCLDIHLHPDDKPTEVLRSLDSRPRRPLDRFSLVVDNQRLRKRHLNRFLAYAAECFVQDLQIDLRRCKPTEKFIFHLPLSSPLLAHLSLRNINISHHFYNRPQTPMFWALEVIRLHSVTSTARFGNVVALCPRLRVLDLRRCYCGHILSVMRGATGIPPPYTLTRVEIAECYGEIRLQHTVSVVEPSRLLSFRYGGKPFPYHFPTGAAPTDLYICLGEPIPYAWDTHRFLPDDLSGLTVLTVCSNALKVVSSLLDDGPNCLWGAKVNKFPNLKELQLLMLGTEMDILADLYVLIKSCGFSKLERLFVQLPDTSDVPLRDSVEDVSVELPGDSLLKLGTVKVVNFNWRRFEVQLVGLLLSKATSLHKLLLVYPSVAPLHVPAVQEAGLLLLEEAFASGRIIFRESDDPATQPFHPEVFIEE